MHRPYWYIPAHKDTRHLASDVSTRTATFDYLRQIAQAVDQLNYRGVLVPTGSNAEESWVIASMLLGFTKQLKFIVAVRPGLVGPSAAARMAATFDRMSNGRLIVNVVGGACLFGRLDQFVLLIDAAPRSACVNIRPHPWHRHRRRPTARSDSLAPNWFRSEHRIGVGRVREAGVRGDG